MEQVSIVQPVPRVWMGRRAESELWTNLAERMNLHENLARLLVARNIYQDRSVESFLSTDRSGMYKPEWLHDVEKVVRRIRTAVERGEQIQVVGDYDVDGVSATTTMVKALRFAGAQPTYHIPSRFTEGGYGLSLDVVDAFAQAGGGLLITVDTGITAIEQAKRVKELGNIDLLVTDHHNFGSDFPDAYAIVHPRYPRHNYAEKELCGAGVAFKIANALLGRLPEELLELVALATVADQVPLLGENRVLVREGLKQINEHPSLGMSALLEASGLSGQRIRSSHIVFQLGPRLNSLGRLKEAGPAVEMFLTEDPNEAFRIAQELNELNRFRKSIQLIFRAVT